MALAIELKKRVKQAFPYRIFYG